jgi:hypothetical protein
LCIMISLSLQKTPTVPSPEGASKRVSKIIKPSRCRISSPSILYNGHKRLKFWQLTITTFVRKLGNREIAM